MTNERKVVDEAVQENAERFAQALLPHVSPPAAPAMLGIPTGGWRGSDGVLTQPQAAQELAATAGGAGADDPDATGERVVIKVQSADLGDLSLVLDRSDTGVRVLIGVADARAAVMMAPEREALLERLVGNGVRVQSLQIVGQKELGTLLAPPRANGSSKAFGPREPVAAENAAAAPRRRGSRKLDVIG